MTWQYKQRYIMENDESIDIYIYVYVYVSPFIPGSGQGHSKQIRELSCFIHHYYY